MNRQPFLYLTGASVIGILLAHFYSLNFSFVVFICAISFLLIFSLILFYKKQNKSVLFLLLSLLIIGFWNYKNQNTLPQNHYTQSFEAFDKNKLQLKIVEELKSSKKYRKYFAEIQFIFPPKQLPKETVGKILLYVPKTEISLLLDDVVVATASYFPIQEENPKLKGYTNYLKRKMVFGKLFLKQILVKQESNSVWKKIHQWKKNTSTELKNNGYSKEVIQLIQSLLFGQRNEMDIEITISFKNLGVMHILSISGLHTAIVFAIVLWIMNQISYGFGGRKFSIAIALFFVVLFTFFVGLQPPVLRTTLMLLLYYGSYFLQRKSSIYHSLYLSAFMLLCFNPNYLFDLGFQLSYTAVFFIVWLYSFFEIKSIKNKIAKYFIDISSVSFAAQIGTLPLTVYYFHSTSLLFLIGNLLFVPFTFAFIVASFFILLFSLFDFNFPILVDLVNYGTNQILQLGFWLSDYPMFIFDELQINSIQVILSYLIIVSIPILFNRNQYHFKVIYFVLFLVLLFLLIDYFPQPQ
jgi:competence protein ComEC